MSFWRRWLRAARSRTATSDADASGTPTLICYRLHDDAPEILPGRPDRDWMDATDQRFAYRCVPLSIANATGWEITSPRSFSATWTGGRTKEDVTLEPLDGGGDLSRLAVSHFAHGILTFHVGYLFRTDPGWALWCRGAPNRAKHGIAALDGLVETDWLPFTFTMNWQFTAPGTVRFASGEPICFVTPIPHLLIERIRPEIRVLAEAPSLKAEHEAWIASRGSFLTKLADNDPDAVKEGWQRFYVRGGRNEQQASTHRTRRRLLAPSASEASTSRTR